jgi:hypothetical protein
MGRFKKQVHGGQKSDGNGKDQKFNGNGNGKSLKGSKDGQVEGNTQMRVVFAVDPSSIGPVLAPPTHT